MLVLLIFGIILMLAGLYNIFLVFLSRNPANLSTTVGSLTKASGYKNVPLKYGGVIPLQTDYTYVYTVNEKPYHYKGRKNQHKRTLPKKVTIMYLRRFPQHSAIDHFTAHMEQALGIMFLIEGAALMILCLVLQLIV